MKKNVVILICVLAVIALLPVSYHKNVKAEMEGKSFLEEAGWKVGRLCEKERIKIPKVLDEVYKLYNQMQKRSGFDIEKFCGRDAIRFTYEIKNHKMADEVYANILMCNGEIIAGDIMTREADGFMHEITRKEYIK